MIRAHGGRLVNRIAEESEKFKGMTGAEIAGYAIGQILSTPVTVGLMALLFAWLGGFL